MSGRALCGGGLMGIRTGQGNVVALTRRDDVMMWVRSDRGVVWVLRAWASPTKGRIEGKDGLGLSR
jgi:hypothetical protein